MRHRHVLRLLVLLTIAGAILASHGRARAAGTVYYVDCTAVSAGNGSATTPWNNLAAANVATFSPGDRVLFRRGTRCTGTFAPTGSGTLAAPIVAAAYGTGPKPALDGNGAPDTVLLRNVQYWELDDLEVTNTASGPGNRRGVRVELTDFGIGHHYRLVDLTVHDVEGDNTKDLGGSAGIAFESYGTSVPTSFDDVLLEGNEVYTVDRSGVVVQSAWYCRIAVACSDRPAWTASTGVVLRDNVIHDVGGDGVMLSVTDHALAEHNTLFDINMRSGTNNAGMWAWNADYTTFQYNEVYRVRRPAGVADGMAFDVDDAQTGTVYQYNYSHDNEGGFIAFCGCGYRTTSRGVVRYNISQNDGSRVILAAGTKASAFYNNTIYLPAGSSTLVLEERDANTDLLLANNIIDNQGSGGYSYLRGTPGVERWLTNLFYGSHPVNEPADPTHLTSDPKLVAPGSGPTRTGAALTPAQAGLPAADLQGYRLTAGSPAMGVGAPVTSNGSLDPFGDPVPTACRPDLGAVQVSLVDNATCTKSLLANGGFESGALAPWSKWNSSVDSSHVHGGTHDVQVGAAPSSTEQDVPVIPGVRYTYSGWALIQGPGDVADVGVKNYGGPAIDAKVTSNRYQHVGVSFVATTTTVTVYCYKEAGAGHLWADDLILTVSAPISSF